MEKPPHKLRFAVLAVDAALFTIHESVLKVLLIPVHKPPFFHNSSALPGGLIHPKETAEAAAKRHLQEKAGVSGVYLEQLFTFSTVDRDPRGRVVSVAYLALVPFKDTKIKKGEGIYWCQVSKLPKLAYDHKEMIEYALERLRNKLEYTNIAYSLLGEEFALSDLQRVYEIILDKKIDKRNFRKKLLALKLVVSIGKKRKGEANRPAELYRFKERRPRVVDIL